MIQSSGVGSVSARDRFRQRLCEIDFLHLGVGLNLRHSSFGEYFPSGEHCDGRGERSHEVHVVLDHDDGSCTADAP
ncbi:hypothetical protein QV65_08695 [Rhodococcus erythropolis]|nr:hypothetical protein QV65_08695 [Rhodococcus erythropolis]